MIDKGKLIYESPSYIYKINRVFIIALIVVTLGMIITFVTFLMADYDIFFVIFITVFIFILIFFGIYYPLTRDRFKIYENGLIHISRPLNYALNRRHFFISFPSIKEWYAVNRTKVWDVPIYEIGIKLKNNKSDYDFDIKYHNNVEFPVKAIKVLKRKLTEECGDRERHDIEKIKTLELSKSRIKNKVGYK